MNMNYEQRRQKLLEDKSGPCMVLIFSGRAPMRSADESYSFSVDRNFYYLTGIERENMILVMTKDMAGNCAEMLYIDIIIINPPFLSYCYLSKQRSSFFQYVPFCILMCHVSHRNMPSFARQKVAFRITILLFMRVALSALFVVNAVLVSVFFIENKKAG